MDPNGKSLPGPEKQSIFERHPKASGFTIFVLLFLILDLGLGAILIPYDFHDFRIRNPWYHHGILPNKSSITNWGQKYYRFYSNSLGFRDDTIKKVPLENDMHRILLLGDSHTEAVGIPYEKSFAGLLAAEGDKHNVEVLNGSAVSYSPRIHYLKTEYLLETKKLDVDEIIVFIDMSDLNNEIAYESFKPKKISPLNTFLRRTVNTLSNYSLTTYMADRLNRHLQNRFFKQNIAGLDNADMELYATFFSEFDNADLLNNPDFHHVARWLENEDFKPLARYSLDLAQQNILKLKDLCEKHDVRLSLSVHPWPEQIIKGDTTNIYVESWKEFSHNQQIRFINFFPVFINHENHVLTARQNYIPHDNHWNENGHKRVAGVLKRHLFKQ